MIKEMERKTQVAGIIKLDGKEYAFEAFYNDGLESIDYYGSWNDLCCGVMSGNFKPSDELIEKLDEEVYSLGN